MTQQWGNVPPIPGPGWDRGAVPVWGPVRLQRSPWAIAGIVTASVGLFVAFAGITMGAFALCVHWLIQADSEGRAGAMWLVDDTARIGAVYVGLPIAIGATVCTVAARVHQRRAEVARGSITASIWLTSILVGLVAIGGLVALAA
jgi:hypothetical protein